MNNYENNSLSSEVRGIKMLFEMEKIRGLKVVALKGADPAFIDKRFKSIKVVYILFSDKKTYIELEEQDFYSYHDCSPYAKYITVCSDVEAWKKIFKYDDANEDIYNGKE